MPGAVRSSYLADTVRVWLGLPRSADVDAPVLPDDLARLFLRLEEHERPGRDRWGCWDFASSENYRAGRLWEPEVDRWLAARRAELAERTALEPLWPEGRRFAVCLTHDVDVIGDRATPGQVARHARAGFARVGAEDESPVLRFARPAGRLVRSAPRLARAPSAAPTLERSVALEAERGLPATYLFTVPPASRTRWDCVYAPGDRLRFRGARRRISDVVRTLADEGFDVGLHGSYLAGVQPGALAAERDALEQATGVEASSTRQHFLHWDVRWTPRFQDEAGFRVDSSLGFNRNAGYRAGTSLPFRQYDVATESQLGLLEVPLVVQDGALLGDEIGLGLDATKACELSERFVATAAEFGGAVTFVFHPDKLSRPEWLRLYEWTLDHVVGQGAWVTSLRDLDAWWRGREARILGS